MAIKIIKNETYCKGKDSRYRSHGSILVLSRTTESGLEKARRGGSVFFEFFSENIKLYRFSRVGIDPK